MTNPYEILGVNPDAGKSEIDATYNRLITEYKNSVQIKYRSLQQPIIRL